MIKLTHILTICAIAILCEVISVMAYASPQRVVVRDDGTMHSVEVVTNNNYTTVTCNKISATIMAEKVDDLQPSIMATIVITNGDQKKGFRIFDVAANKLTPGHSSSSIKVGCLTREGGVGINVPHFASDELELKIQIDLRGRVFLGYDEVGLELVTSPK